MSRCLEKTLRDLCCKNKLPVGLFSGSAQLSASIPEDEVSDNFISFYLTCSNHAASSSQNSFCDCIFRDLLPVKLTKKQTTHIKISMKTLK